MEQRDADNSRLIMAAQEGDLESVKYLLAPRAHVNTMRKHSDNGKTYRLTPLRQALQNNHPEVIKYLLDNRADPNTTIEIERHNVKTDIAPVLFATMFNGTQVVSELLKANADPNAADERGFTVLMSAAEAGNEAMVKSLLDARAAVNSYAHDALRRTTALHQAAQYGHCQTAVLLLQAGADLHALRSNRSTPLQTAVDHNQKQMVQLLTQRTSQDTCGK